MFAEMNSLKMNEDKRRMDAYMGVSLNGGTPKTPQNDHF